MNLTGKIKLISLKINLYQNQWKAFLMAVWNLSSKSEPVATQWFCMCQFENSEKGSKKVLKIQNFNKINCFYDFLDIWPKFWAFFGFFGFFIYKPPYKNFWKKNLGPMSAGNETTVES